MYYVGKLAKNNVQFDSCTGGKPFRFRLGASEVIQGWDSGVAGRFHSIYKFILWPKYLKEQMIFSRRHYFNICPVQQPINSITSDQDCSILLQHFEEVSKFETRRKNSP